MWTTVTKRVHDDSPNKIKNRDEKQISDTWPECFFFFDFFFVYKFKMTLVRIKKKSMDNKNINCINV